LIESGVDFAFETTLATRSYVSFIEKAKVKNYNIILVL
jgi:predicted ABC-type ATPase